MCVCVWNRREYLLWKYDSKSDNIRRAYTQYISALGRPGRKRRSETGYGIISLHTNTVMIMHGHAPDVCGESESRGREAVRWIGTGGEVMLDHFADTAIRELGHVGGAGGSGNRKNCETIRK